MKIEKTGWYRRRDGELAYVYGILPESVRRSTYSASGVTAHGLLVTWTLDGIHTKDVPGDMDLIEYLPDCTGWDWKPERWRDAKLDDILTPNHARFWDDAIDASIFTGVLCGIKFCNGKLWYCKEDSQTWWMNCQIKE